jgi:hypothetical protein
MVKCIKRTSIKAAECTQRMRETRSACKICVRKSKGKRKIETSGHRKQDNTKIDFSKIGCEDVEWMTVSQNGVHIRPF